MKHNKLLKLMAVVMVLVMAISLFVACGPEEEPKPEPPKPEAPEMMGEKLVEFYQSIMKAYDISDKETIKMDIDAGFSYSGLTDVKYGLKAKGNIDLVDTAKDNSNFYVTFEDRAGETASDIIAVYYQNGQLYLKAGEELFAIRGFNMLSLFGKVAGSSSVALADSSSSIEGILAMIGDLALPEGSVVNDNGVWTLTIDTVKVWDFLMNGYDNNGLKSVVEGLLNDLNLVIAGQQLTYDTITDFINGNQIVITVKADLTKKNAPTMSVNIENKLLGKVNVDLKSMVVDNGTIEVPAEEMLSADQIAAAKEINLANIDINGTFSLFNADKKAYMNYEWRLMVNIDPFAFVEASNEYKADGKNPYDFWHSEALKGSKLYFQVYHVHDRNCAKDGSFCSSRLDSDITNVVDIVFDPENMGNPYLYVNLNTQAILSDSALSTVLDMFGAGMASTFVKGILNSNEMMIIDPSAIAEPYITGYSKPVDVPGEESAVALADGGIDINSIFGIVEDVFGFIKDGGILFNINSRNILDIGVDVNAALALGAKLGLEDALSGAGLSMDKLNTIVQAIFADKNNAFRGFYVTVDDITFGNPELDSFNGYEAMIKDPVTGEDRVWDKKPVDPKTISEIEWSFSDIEGVYKDGVPFAPEEIANLIGETLTYSYKTLDGSVIDSTKAMVQIVGVKDIVISEEMYGKEQNVKLVVTPVDGEGVLGSALQLLTGLGASFLPAPLKLPLPCFEVPFKMTLTEATNVEITLNKQPDEAYYLNTLSTKVTDCTKATANVTYANGETKNLSLEPSATDLYKEGKDYYLMGVGTNYVEFSFAGFSEKFELTMAMPDKVEANFGTKENPVEVAVGQDIYARQSLYFDEKNKSDFLTMPTFNNNEVKLTYTEAGLEYNIYPESYFYDGCFPEGVVVEGKFAKAGTYEYVLKFRGLEIPGCVKVVDGAKKTTIVSTTMDYSKNIIVNSSEAKDMKVTVNFTVADANGKIVDPSLYKMSFDGKEGTQFVIDIKADQWAEDSKNGNYKYTIKPNVNLDLSNPALKKGYHYLMLDATVETDSAVLIHNNMGSSFNKSTYGHGEIEGLNMASGKQMTAYTTFDGLAKLYYSPDGKELVTLTAKFVDGKYQFVSADGKYKFDATVKAVIYNTETEVKIDADGTLTNDIADVLKGSQGYVTLYWSAELPDGVVAEGNKYYTVRYTGQFDGTSKFGQKVSDYLAGPKLYVANDGEELKTLTMQWKNGKYVFSDGTTDIDATIVMPAGYELVEGKLPSSAVGQKLVATIKVTIDGKEYSTEYTYSSIKA